MEKVHSQFLKRIMGCDIHSSNHMVRGEVGKRSLICDVITRSTLYIKHVDSIGGSFANLALDIEASLEDENNVLSLVSQYTSYYKETDYLPPKNSGEIKLKVNQKYDTFWKSELTAMSKSDTYLLIKENVVFEKYMGAVKNYRHRIALSRFRISNHSLWIEKGRHMKPMIERDNRFCDFCKTEIEDEHHFLLCCPLYGPKRIILENVCRNTCNRYDLLNKDEKFIFIMSNEDKEVLKALGKYFSEGMRLRDKIVEYFFT